MIYWLLICSLKALQRNSMLCPTARGQAADVFLDMWRWSIAGLSAHTSLWRRESPSNRPRNDVIGLLSIPRHRPFDRARAVTGLQYRARLLVDPCPRSPESSPRGCVSRAEKQHDQNKSYPNRVSLWESFLKERQKASGGCLQHKIHFKW